MSIVTISHTVVGTGASPTISIPAVDNPRLIGMVHVDSGSPVYSIQYTLDGLRWHPLESDLSGLTASEDFSVVFPAKALRLVVEGGTPGETTIICRYDNKGFS